MQLEDVMAELEAAGSAQTCKTYTRHGIPGPMFGVSFAKLGELKKRIKRDLSLAESLWATGVADARFLATMVAGPDIPEATLEAWVQELRGHTMAGSVAKLAATTPYAAEKMNAWIEDPAESVARTGWDLVAQLALESRAMGDQEFAALLPRIEAKIHQARNREKEGMHNALLAIGARSDTLEAMAIEAAVRIGPVDVDHGDTNCKTPESVPYIQKARAHRRAKEEKALARR